MNIVMLGAPGAGKGTIAKKLEEKYHLPHVSTGDLFRENIKNNTSLGQEAKTYMDKGALVPNTVTINMLLDRISKDDCKNGFILDGFPRNLAQADGLKDALAKKSEKIDLAILMDAKDEDIVKRLSGRRVCESCGTPYHIETLKPKVDGICDKCGGKLIQRKDDTEEVIRDRLKVYHEQTQVLIEYYDKEGILLTMNGFDSIENILSKLEKVIKL